MTHKELCEVAVQWLKRPQSRLGPGCLIALAETGNWANGEIPDAIGWRPFPLTNRGGSVLVEVKVSHADFLADANKPHRVDGEKGVGVFRYYLAPEGIISLGELPRKWGLVEVTEKGRIKVRAGHVLANSEQEDAWRHKCDQYAEICTLVSCLNRVGDPQKVQDRLRQADNAIARLSEENQGYLAKHREMLAEIFRLRDGDRSALRRIPARPPKS